MDQDDESASETGEEIVEEEIVEESISEEFELMELSEKMQAFLSEIELR